jgi:hypothetical protein
MQRPKPRPPSDPVAFDGDDGAPRVHPLRSLGATSALGFELKLGQQKQSTDPREAACHISRVGRPKLANTDIGKMGLHAINFKVSWGAASVMSKANKPLYILYKIGTR